MISIYFVNLEELGPEKSWPEQGPVKHKFCTMTIVLMGAHEFCFTVKHFGPRNEF